MIANQFYIDSWHAWLPGIDEHGGDWLGFFRQQWQANESNADVGFLPAMQRRRLSPLARAVAHVLHHCSSAAHEQMIFCTRYGEVARTDTILRDIAKQQDVSPTAFGLSVFNAIAGQMSILQKNTAAMSTLIPAEDDYLTAFVDALGCLQQGAESLTLVFYEEPLSEVLSPYCYELPCLMAVAVRISSKPKSADDQAWRLRYMPTKPTTYAPGSGILELMRFFTLNESQIQLGHWKVDQQ